MLYSNPDTYIFTWLGTYGGATGAIAGVLIADYWYLRKTNLKLADLYRTDGAYRYSRGWNWNAVIALLVGIVLAIGGSYSAGGQPFPVDGIIPLLKPLADYSWVVGLIVSFVVYVGLMRFMPRGRTATEMASQPA
jgi:NCS1 family nucleobase:cation symporter-1